MNLNFMKLQGTVEFLSAVGKMYRSFRIHQKHSSLVPLSADKYEANLKSIANYVNSSVDEVKDVTGKNITNGPDETVSSKTASDNWYEYLNNMSHLYEIHFRFCL